jgi:glycosyltransferase involved in cell wall biosynthesis
MDILFIHQNFPGQFKRLAEVLAQNNQNRVLALSMSNHPTGLWNGVQIIRYSIDGMDRPNARSWFSEFEIKAIRAEACFKTALELKKNGFHPQIIVAHPAWGESLYIKEVWPNAKLGIYSEFYYRATGLDVGFDPAQTSLDPSQIHRFNLKNINNLLHFEIADAGISPTQWQASTFPESFQKKITVIHDGIDTDLVKPNQDVSLMLNSNLTLTKNDELITFVSRNLEPYRGYHIFMRVLPALLKRRPNAKVLIVGGQGVSYGPVPPAGTSWADIFANEVRSQISDADWQRVYILGKLPYQSYLALIQISTVHIYLTYPFVLSWSLLEAMSAGCAVIASDTSPVTEVIKDGVNGKLVPFFDLNGWVNGIEEMLENHALRTELGRNARQTIISNYDLRTVCVPKQLDWVQSLL